MHKEKYQREAPTCNYLVLPQGVASRALEALCVCGACMARSHGAPRMGTGVPGVRVDQIRCTQT